MHQIHPLLKILSYPLEATSRKIPYFLIQNNKINNLPSLTVKELRFAHNLEKMYNAGAFNDR